MATVLQDSHLIEKYKAFISSKYLLCKINNQSLLSSKYIITCFVEFIPLTIN